MTVLTIPQCAYVWESNGGSRRTVVLAVAVSTAESGRRTDAISPSSDYGLWQINSSNFASQGLTTTTALEASPNARAAIRMSANGDNWAPWCTCWINPAADCGHGNLPYPQAGSPAYDQIALVARVLGQSPPTPPPHQPGPPIPGHPPTAAQSALIMMVNDYKTYNNTRLMGHARWHRSITQVVAKMVE